MTPHMVKFKIITPLRAFHPMREISPSRGYYFDFPFLWPQILLTSWAETTELIFMWFASCDKFRNLKSNRWMAAILKVEKSWSQKTFGQFWRHFAWGHILYVVQSLPAVQQNMYVGMWVSEWVSVCVCRYVSEWVSECVCVLASTATCISDGFQTLQSMRRERILATGSVRWIPDNHKLLSLILLLILSVHITCTASSARCGYSHACLDVVCWLHGWTP